MRVRLSEQIVDFTRRLAPEPRKLVRQGLRDLAHEEGDIKPLEAPLDSYCRLRIGGFRVIFQYATAKRIDCIFIERRSLVYEVFAEEIARRLEQGEPSSG